MTKIVTEAMLPCPFCPGPVHRRTEHGVEGCFHIAMPHCPVASHRLMTVEQWNHRTAMSTAQEPALERERCDFCNYPRPPHSDICVAWHSQRSLEPPTGSPALDDDAGVFGGTVAENAAALLEWDRKGGWATNADVRAAIRIVASAVLQAKAPETD